MKTPKIFLLLLMLLPVVSLIAQPSSGSVFEEVTDTPINAGMALIAAAGIGYGLKQLKKRKV